MPDSTDPPKVERVLCTGGPGGDFYHEVEYGWPVPDRMGLPDDDGVLRFYDVVDGVARYSEHQDGMIQSVDIVWREEMLDDTRSLGFICFCPDCGYEFGFCAPDGPLFRCSECDCLLKVTRSPEGPS